MLSNYSIGDAKLSDQENKNKAEKSLNSKEIYPYNFIL